jgi:AAA ATPase domain
VAFPTAPGALRAAAQALEGLGPGPIRVRMGIHTGTPHVAEEGYVGVDVHRAARIAACGHGGQVLVSAATAALLGTDGLRDLGEHRLKDLSAAERIYQLGDVDFPALHSLHQTNLPASNLPIPSTPLIGRHAELADLRALLHGTTRLVTLTGPGGTGKTRLALELAHALTGEGEGVGAWFVDLAPSTEVWQAISAIQAALGVTDAAGDDPLEPLRGFLRPHRLLLVLDNLEQVPNVAGVIATLLAAAPGLRTIATSRTPLRIGGEQEVPLSPLPVGTAGEVIDVEAPPDAVALFVARARAGVPGFTITATTAATVAELCRRLDGLPLAIELAASRVRLLSPAAILERLAAGLEILRAERRDLPARQWTLEAAFDWSYRLLASPLSGRSAGALRSRAASPFPPSRPCASNPTTTPSRSWASSSSTAWSRGARQTRPRRPASPCSRRSASSPGGGSTTRPSQTPFASATCASSSGSRRPRPRRSVVPRSSPGCRSSGTAMTTCALP